MNKKDNNPPRAKEKEENVHKEHRSRLRAKLADTELDKIPEHEVLEALLFYAIPYKDTNKTAHELINKFGSLKNVLNASYDDLMSADIDKIKESASYMICFFRKVAMLYLKKERIGGVFELNNTEALNEYCRVLFLDAHCEQLRVVFLSDDLELKKDKLLGIGTPGKLNISFRTIIEDVLKEKCSRIVITHNHPVGTCIPSNADVNYTCNLWKALKPMDIELVDHVVVGSDGEWSMRSHSSLPEIWGYNER